MSQPRLTKSLIAAGGAPGVPHGPLGDLPERFLQFGGGNFLRAFADWMIDVANGQGAINGRVVIVQSMSRDRGGVAAAQDGLATVLTRGLRHGQVVDEPRILTSVSRSLSANDAADWAQVRQLAASPDLRFVLSNTTEAGIVFARDSWTPGKAPASFPGKLCAVLHDRWQALGAAAPGLVVLPCELIEKNGQQLRAAVLATAHFWELPGEFIAWVESACTFCDTLVDRIVPGGPGAEAPALAQRLGYDDQLLTIAEPYHIWAIDAPEFVAAELPFAQLGLNVVWTHDLAKIRTRKVRVLNGGHTGLALAGYLAGADTVIQLMDDPLLGGVMTRLLEREIAPTLPPSRENAAYVPAIIERFRNPFLQHELLAISLNSVAKWKVRILPTLKDALAARQPAPLMIASLAALIAFYRGTPVGERELAGTRNGRTYPIKDDPAVLASFARRWAEFAASGDLRTLVDQILGDAALWGEDLRTLNLAPPVTTLLHQIVTQGFRPALANLVTEAP